MPGKKKPERPAGTALTLRARKIFNALKKEYPTAHCELDFRNPLQLAIAAILSAQCTDKRVNMVTPALFKKYRTARDWAGTRQEVLEEEIRSTGFYRNKAKSIRALCRELVDKHNGEIPDDFDILVKLPGFGRKTANVIMVTAFGQPGIVVDTHAMRVSQRLGLTRQKDPVKIEFDLQKLFPKKNWGTLSHLMVFHGRYCCTARKPACARCPVHRLCPSAPFFI